MRLNFGPYLILLCLFIACNEKDKLSQDTIDPHPNPLIDTLEILFQGDSLYLLGEYYDSLNNKDSAQFFHELALEARLKILKGEEKLFNSYYKVAKFYSGVFKYDVADHYFDKARLIASQAQVSPEIIIKLYIDAANCKANLKDIASSLTLLKGAKGILTDNPDLKSPSYFISIFRSMAANSYYEGNYEQSIAYLNQSIGYIDSDDRVQLSRAWHFMGMAYRSLNNYDMAIHYFNRSIEQTKKWSQPNLKMLADTYLQKAFAHEKIGELDSTLFYLVHTLEIRKKIHGEKNINTYGGKYSIAEFYMDVNKYDSALHYYHEGLVSLIKNFNNHNYVSNPVPQVTELNLDLVDGLVGKATALKKLGDQNINRISNYSVALNSYLLADSVFRQFLNAISFDDPRLNQLESKQIPYDVMLELVTLLYAETMKGDYLQQALNVLEYSRARVLSIALSQAEQYGGEGVSREYSIRKGELIKQRSEILRMLSHVPEGDDVSDSLHIMLLELNNQVSRLEHDLEEANPTYSLVKQGKEVTIADVSAQLRKQNSIFLGYLWSDEKIQVVGIYPDSIKVFSILLTEELKETFDLFTKQLIGDPEETYKYENFEQYCKSSFKLYQELIKEFLPELLSKDVSLIISADGPLAAFPFEALITDLPESNEVDYRLPYLMTQYSVSYAYSPSIMIYQNNQQRSGSKLLALGFAGNGPSKILRNGMSGLPGTEREVLAIKEVMKNHVNKYLLKEDASESNFKKMVSDFDIAHLAIHGIADSVNTLESKLVFRTEADTTEDGNLYAHELYSLNLRNLDLAVLSACESGVGKHQVGEGVMSIARGFAYAGCPSQVVSLWKIDDRVSATIMENFYRHLSNGEEISRALTLAKKGYISSSKELNSHPIYWAAFLQMGDKRPINSKTINWKFWIIGFIGVVILLSFYLVQRSYLTSRTQARFKWPKP